MNLNAVSDTSWSQTTLTWNNHPVLGSVLATFTPTLDGLSDLTIALATLNAPLFSLKLARANESTTAGTSYLYFASTSNGDYQIPYLTVETTTAAVPLPGGAVLLGGGLLRLYASWCRRRD